MAIWPTLGFIHHYLMRISITPGFDSAVESSALLQIHLRPLLINNAFVNVYVPLLLYIVFWTIC